MRSAIFFVGGLFFGYWFYYFRMFIRIMKFQKQVDKAQAEIAKTQADIDQFLLETRAVMTEEQWNEDKL